MGTPFEPRLYVSKNEAGPITRETELEMELLDALKDNALQREELRDQDEIIRLQRRQISGNLQRCGARYEKTLGGKRRLDETWSRWATPMGKVGCVLGCAVWIGGMLAYLLGG